MGTTLAEKVWADHLVRKGSDGAPDLLYIDLMLMHEVTSPQAFEGLRLAGRKPRHLDQLIATEDHNTPTADIDRPNPDKISALQLSTLEKNCKDFGVRLCPLGDADQGVVHAFAPVLGLTQPGMTIVCGDSHTSTHGAFGAMAIGIGTSEVEHVMATQTLSLKPFKTMAVNIEGELPKRVTAKDIILAIIAKIGTGGGQGHVIEYRGEAIKNLSMDARMTICNMSIEAGARAGMIAPDEVTFEYLKGRPHAPEGEMWDKAIEYWKTLKTDDDAVFDKEYRFDAADIAPMITYGTNPGMGMGITRHIPTTEEMREAAKASFMKSMYYMGFRPGDSLLGKKIDYVFLGACTNGRIEDFRAFASIVKGRRKAADVVAWLVPGSWLVDAQIREEGLDKVLEEAGFAIRQPGCSACLAMNDDKVPAGKYAVSTSNRNFEGRQGPGARTLLASPLVAAAAAVTGVITDPRELM